jgi:carboxyl-terminal processing protease
MNPLSPAAYLEQALSVMRSNAVYAPDGGWTAVDVEATKMAAAAKTPADTYPAIQYAIAQLQQAGDLHAGFSSPAESRLEEQILSSPRTSSPPDVSLPSPRIGLISVPAIESGPRTPDTRRYALSALEDISSLERRQHPCGWIVDLRGDTGGDMWPMLLSLGPIIGSGRLIAFSGKSGTKAWVAYRKNALAGAGLAVRAPMHVVDFRPAPAVAILIGANTISSGEAVAIAFRPGTRTFGTATAGLPTSPRTYRLADGASIRFSSYWGTDRLVATTGMRSILRSMCARTSGKVIDPCASPPPGSGGRRRAEPAAE